MKYQHDPDGPISIHALREEGDHIIAGLQFGIAISIHALREEGDYSEVQAVDADLISIHALREEGDDAVSSLPVFIHGFLSTPSARRATLTPDWLDWAINISIHALREEGDNSVSTAASSAA